ncbi:hypothetical protein ACIRQY_19960 [Streptomyces sp. NPDC101490]|uniref:hypothetical protein n=1 Tax=Streptomyces sp. NPDC101490 TaxID=3366143 RepID=UPI0038194C6B
MNVPVSAYEPDFRPTHVVPREGLDAWEAPDPGTPTAPLDAFLPVRLEERAGDWGRVRCSNGWTAWVDARLLVSVPDDPPAAGRPLARTADPRPLVARAEDALGRYRRAAEELASHRLDREGFRLRTRGLRVGMVVDGESVWLYDAEHERWVYCDGVGLSTYAASAAPSPVAGPESGPKGADVRGAGVQGAGAEAAPGTVVVGPGSDPATDPASGPEPDPEPGTEAGTEAGAEPGPGTSPEADAGTAPETVVVATGPPGTVVVAPSSSGTGPAPEEDGASPEEAGPGPSAAVPPAHEPTRVVTRIDAPESAGPPPTRVVTRPPEPAGEDG